MQVEDDGAADEGTRYTHYTHDIMRCTLYTLYIPYTLYMHIQVDVQSPEEYLGDVMGDLNSRRGQIE